MAYRRYPKVGNRRVGGGPRPAGGQGMVANYLTQHGLGAPHEFGFSGGQAHGILDILRGLQGGIPHQGFGDLRQQFMGMDGIDPARVQALMHVLRARLQPAHGGQPPDPHGPPITQPPPGQPGPFPGPFPGDPSGPPITQPGGLGGNGINPAFPKPGPGMPNPFMIPNRFMY